MSIKCLSRTFSSQTLFLNHNNLKLATNSDISFIPRLRCAKCILTGSSSVLARHNALLVIFQSGL